MWKTASFALILSLSPVSQASVHEKTPEEIRLVRMAEEISAGDLDDDEKIELLSDIRSRVGELRQKRAAATEKETAAQIGDFQENPRPLSALVRKQALETVDPTPGTTEEERGPGAAFRAPLLLKRVAGWSIILGTFAAVLFWGYVLFLGFCEKSGQPDLAAFAFRRRAELRRFKTGRNAASADTMNVARDGMVPERLR